MANLLATKTLDMLLAESKEEDEHSLKRALGPMNLIIARYRGNHWRWNFCPDRTGGSRTICVVPLSYSPYFCGNGLRFCRLVLCGICRADSYCRLRLYLWVCHLGEIFAWIIGWDLVWNTHSAQPLSLLDGQAQSWLSCRASASICRQR